jgi:hypothetical protein
VAHSFTGGTAIGTKLIVVTGFDGVTGDTNTVEASDCGGGGVTPTPTPTATPTATPGPCQFQVLIVYADTALPTQLQSEILAEPGVTACDLFDATVGTPTLAQLQQYNIVVPYSNFPFLDADTLGNNLADYVDGGGIVVQHGFSHLGPGEPYGVNGRWLSGNYNPYDYSENFAFNPFTLGTFNAGHPLMAGVTSLNSDFQNVVTPNGAATEVAATNLGTSLVAYDGGRYSLCWKRCHAERRLGEGDSERRQVAATLRNSEPNTNSNGYTYTYSYPNSNSYSYADSYADTHGDTASAYAKAAAHAVSSADAAVRVVKG